MLSSIKGTYDIGYDSGPFIASILNGRQHECCNGIPQFINKNLSDTFSRAFAAVARSTMYLHEFPLLRFHLYAFHYHAASKLTSI